MSNKLQNEQMHAIIIITSIITTVYFVCTIISVRVLQKVRRLIYYEGKTQQINEQVTFTNFINFKHLYLLIHSKTIKQHLPGVKFSLLILSVQ